MTNDQTRMTNQPRMTNNGDGAPIRPSGFVIDSSFWFRDRSFWSGHWSFQWIVLLALCVPALAQESSPTWWNQLWPYRVRIDCPPGAGEAAQVDVTLAGRTTPDGTDLRLVDASGKQQPFVIVYHDPLLQTLLAVKVPDGKAARLWLYFGHVRAQKISTTQPDARVAGWETRAGVMLRTYAKAKPAYPKTLPELLKMVGEARQDGGGFVAGISQGHNLFGGSDQYLSVYDGYLRIDRPGSYGFCTASADGSWINVNDKPVVQWPGPHDWGGSEHGQISGTIDLQKGIARIKYYHEAGAGPQMAFMGWKPSGQERFVPVPNEQWIKVRQATASSYESPKKPLLAIPQVEVVSTYWLPDTIGKQIALVRVSDRSTTRAEKIAQVKWNFGDGLEAEGPKQEHVYFRMGRPTIELSVSDSDGNRDSIACAPNIFLLDVQAADVHVGNAETYAKEAADYDAQKMPREDLSLYVEFWQRLERWDRFVPAAKLYVQRFADAPDAGEIAARAAHLCAEPLAFDPKLADFLYEQALARISDSEPREKLLLGRAKNLAFGLDKFDEAKAIYEKVRETPRGRKPGRNSARAATIGLGDIALLGGDLAAARDQYTRAEQMTDRKSPDQATELAKLGSYPWAVDDYLARSEYDEALDTLDEWENGFPLQKLEGTSLLLRGKVLFIRKPCEPALKYLELAEIVNPTGPQVPEAVWLRANCLMALNKTPEAAVQFARVSTEFTRSEFAAKAREKLAECEKKLAAKDQ